MSRIPVVFVPGLAADARLWQSVMDKLASAVEPTVAACKGNSIVAWADEILSGAPDRFFIAGTSMGGYVALEVALRGDDRLAGVILLNTNARSASPQQRERGGALIDEVRNGRFDQVVDRLAVVDPLPELGRLAGELGIRKRLEVGLERGDILSLVAQTLEPAPLTEAKGFLEVGELRHRW